MKFIITLSVALFTMAVQAQDSFLTVINPSEWNSELMYPPGTKFELKDKAGKVLVSDKSPRGTYDVEAPATLTVNPSWRDKPDVFYLNSGSLKLREPIRISAEKGSTKKQNKSSFNHGVSVQKELFPSENYFGLKNVKLTFSNGVVFTYTDGKYKATLEGENLEIKGKYLVYSKLGVHKFSFNPSSGIVYWVFEPAG